MDESLTRLRKDLVDINYSLLDLLCRRARLVLEVHSVKERQGLPTFVPEREQQMLRDLVARNDGPFPDATVRHLFKEIFRASVSLMEDHREGALKIGRTRGCEDLIVRTAQGEIGGEPVIVAGPCAVESEEQMEQIAADLALLGVRFLRGGCYKPRSSPYAFQGMGEPGLAILRRAASRHGMACVTEVMDTRTVELAGGYADILQIGARNMHNYALLKMVGQTNKPVLLKRGFAATIEEFLWAAEYIVSEGNPNVILCERGIRTFERQTRNTLDISAVALLRQMSFLPVIADISHAAGRKDILAPLGRAALAAGANGLMVEVHPFPAMARSDSQQQLDVEEFRRFLDATGLMARTQQRTRTPELEDPVHRPAMRQGGRA